MNFRAYVCLNSSTGMGILIVLLFKGVEVVVWCNDFSRSSYDQFSLVLVDGCFQFSWFQAFLDKYRGAVAESLGDIIIQEEKILL